ncbi:hypothetical protein HDU97_004052 [Phlyctochytrium planicorne]|nr:hypothetical protein HDU97_004052 [Phlyctochytrium planicorne]
MQGKEAKLAAAKSNASRKPPFPNEILLLVFELVPTSGLLTIRRSSSAFRALADVTLCERLRLQIMELSVKHTVADEGYRETERERRPHLRHYRQFLRNITTNEITEATWYATPPEELKTVCECLCILKGSPSFHVRKSTSLPSTSSLPSLPSAAAAAGAAVVTTTGAVATGPAAAAETQSAGALSAAALVHPEETPMTWAHIKKTMTRYDFKTWLTNLRVGVDYIPFQNVKRVERIIMMDPNVTYERLREVSMAGYKLLIIVAACLQYCAISEDLRVRRRDMVAIEKKLSKFKMFVEAAGTDNVRDKALPDVEEEDGSSSSGIGSSRSVGTSTQKDGISIISPTLVRENGFYTFGQSMWDASGSSGLTTAEPEEIES